jgi:glycosyltransferase involved in cell wall biosynthesis
MLRLARDAVLGVLPALVLLRRCAGDGVYVNTTIAPSWLLLGRLARRRVLCHVHEAEWPGPAVLHRLLLSPLMAAHTVVANSAFTREVLTRLLPALGNRVVVVPNPVPGPVAPRPARDRIDGAVRLVFLGRLSPRKGPDVAIATLGELVNRGVDARLTLVGSVYSGYEWFESGLRLMATTEGLSDRVTFLGFRPDIWPVLRDADLVLVPSVLDESFGNAAVEAVLAARPTLVSDLAGLREATAGYAAVRVVEPGRVERWADAVQRIVGDWPRMAAAARRDAEDARARHAVDRYRQRLADVVGGHRPDALPPSDLAASEATRKEAVPR